ncbi:Starvation lipoprotein Slp [Lysobacter capsici AZ78]|uniref:Starvation lipoprotein Slp n=1 Tax=Lysobacter capsici AZ78 TaxID=1444315 RepID=A0A108UCJ9_9GAMM|nr:Slp family lipoprotein [Lysobacter capsici]KWS06761.1 Starvation lipoprotein Slp [Lysobacter capsici AZ78]
MDVRGLVSVVCALGLASCASGGPSPSHTDAVAPITASWVADPLRGDFDPITPGEAADTDRLGATVRWGGGIDRVVFQDGRSCFTMRAARLTPSGRPDWTRESNNERFVACRAGFYDALRFAPFREVTFVGRIDGHTQLDGERVATIEARVVYLFSDCLDIDAATDPQCAYGPVEPGAPPGDP